MKPEIIKKREEVIQQHIVFRLVMEIAPNIFFPYYYILLYKELGSLDFIFLERTVYFLSLWMGYAIFTFLVDRLGYLHSFRVSMILQALSFVLAFFLLPNIKEYYLLLAILLAFTRGTFWPINQAINLKELHGMYRGKVINVNFSLLQLMAIILPVMSGALADFSSEGLRILLILVVSGHIISTTFPWRYNKLPRSKIRSSEFTRILKKNSFGKMAWITILDSGSGQVIASLYLIIPYILIGSEFGVGGLATLTGMFAAMAAFYERNLSIKNKTPIAYFGYIAHAAATLVFCIIWTVPLLTIQGLFSQLRSAISGTAYEDLRYQTVEKMLGDFKEESAIEFNLIRETLVMFGRVSALLFVYILLKNVDSEIEVMSKWILIATACIPLSIYFFTKKLSDSLKK